MDEEEETAWEEGETGDTSLTSQQLYALYKADEATHDTTLRISILLGFGCGIEPLGLASNDDDESVGQTYFENGEFTPGDYEKGYYEHNLDIYAAEAI